jgi:hypothetical protein
MRSSILSILVLFGILLGSTLNTNQKSVSHFENLEEAVAFLIREESPSISEKEIRILSNSIVRYSQDLKIPTQILINKNPIDPTLFLLSVIKMKSNFSKDYNSGKSLGYMGINEKIFSWYKDKSSIDLNQKNLILESNYNIRAGILYINDIFINTQDLDTVIENYMPTPQRKSYKDKTNPELFIETYSIFKSKIRLL